MVCDARGAVGNNSESFIPIVLAGGIRAKQVKPGQITPSQKDLQYDTRRPEGGNYLDRVDVMGGSQPVYGNRFVDTVPVRQSFNYGNGNRFVDYGGRANLQSSLGFGSSYPTLLGGTPQYLRPQTGGGGQMVDYSGQ
jgi:hypothetical protein